jgi:hypothetical protein
MKEKKQTSPKSRKPAKKPVIKSDKGEPVRGIKELLLSGPRFDLEIPPRRRFRRRPSVIFD